MASPFTPLCPMSFSVALAIAGRISTLLPSLHSSPKELANSSRVVLAAFLALTLLLLLPVACGSEAAQPAASSPPARTPVAPVAPFDRASAATGEQLAQQYGCNVCHSPDGSALVGPTWQGLYGTMEELEDGSSALVDDAYITESILDPNAKITRGFTAGLMPATLGVKDDEIPHIIEYMKSLR